MNEYNIKVDFTKGKIFTNLKKLVQNDYNTTKLNFTFDKEGRVLFKLLYPDGTQYIDEIQNNELVFGPGILNQEGTYEYEIALYTEDGRLTDHAVKSFEVRSELVNTDEIVAPDDRVPVLDNLINEANQINNIDVDIEDSVITIKRKDGSVKTENVKGEKGDKGDAGSVKFITANELPTENIEESAIYMIPSGETEGNTYQKYIYVNGAWESLGGTSGLDLENLTLDVTEIEGYQRLSMSDGTTTKTVDIPISEVSTSDIQESVNTYLTENPPTEMDNILNTKTPIKSITLDEVEYYSGEVSTNGSITTSSTHYSDFIDIVGAKQIEFILPTAGGWVNYNFECIFYDSEKVEFLRKRFTVDENGVITISNIGDKVCYVVLNGMKSWAFSNSATLNVYGIMHELILNEDVKVNTKSLIQDYEYMNLFDKEKMLLYYYSFKVGDNLEDFRSKEAGNSSMNFLFIPVKPNTNYTMVYLGGRIVTITDLCVCDFRENVIWVGHKNNDGSPATVTAITTFNGGEYAVITTNDLSLEDATYLGIRVTKDVDANNIIIYEGLPENFNGYVPYETGNGFKYDDDLRLQDKNFPLDKLKILDEVVIHEELEPTYPTVYDHYYHAEIGLNPLEEKEFSIGQATTLFNTARFVKETSENDLKISSYFSHVGTMVEKDGKAYCVYIENKTGSYDGPDKTEVSLRMSVVDLETMTIEEGYDISGYGSVCGENTVALGSGDGNVVVLDNIVRITFTSKLTDGNWYILYRDFDITNKTLSDIGVTKLIVDATTYDFTTTNISEHISTLSNTNVPIYMSSQYSKYETDGYYYINIGVDEQLKNGAILRTLDFINFELWTIPETIEIGMKYEMSCLIKDTTMFCAYRLANYTEMYIVAISMSTKAITGQMKIKDCGSRPFLFVHNNDLYLMHSMKTRNTVDIELIGVGGGNTVTGADTLCQGYKRVYPTMVSYNDEMYILSTKDKLSHIYLTKFTPFPYNRNNTIPVLNKLLDLLGNA